MTPSTIAVLIQVGQIISILLGVLLVAVAGEWLIDWLDRRASERHARPKYTTADARQIERETQQLWQRWHDTVPPVDHPVVRPIRRIRAGMLRPDPDAPSIEARRP